MIRKLQELGLKTRYETDQEFNIKVKSLPALAFVPPEDVCDRYDELVECCFRILKIRMLEGPSTAMGGEENQDSLHESGINLSMACSWNLKLQTAAKVSTMGLPTCIYVHIPTCGHFLKGYKKTYRTTDYLPQMTMFSKMPHPLTNIQGL